MAAPIRIANISGFFGDRPSAAREMIDGGRVDVLTGDWLAELTMLILARMRARRPDGGYGRTFVDQMSDVLGDVMQRGITVVTNAGGLDPRACAAAVAEVADRLGVSPRIATVTGDDLMPVMSDLADAGERFEHLDTGEPLGDRIGRLVTSNAYFGGWGIAAALDAGADIVITGRVTDAALVVGPAAWHHGWKRTDWDRLAGAVVAGHVIECGTQATGGNYSFFDELEEPVHLGFPWAEIAEDGSSVIGKHPDSGGEVSLGTVLSQLLYEIGSPRYHNPDVTARFDTIHVADHGEDRVELSGTVGEPPPAGLKVSAAFGGGFRNSVLIGLTGGDIDEKRRLVEKQFWDACPWGPDDYDEVSTELIGRPVPGSNPSAMCYLRIAVRDQDERKVGRAWSNAYTSIALGSIPGFFGEFPPGSATPYAVMWPTTVTRSRVAQIVTVADQEFEVTPTPVGQRIEPAPVPSPGDVWDGAETELAPIGTIVGARSGDKAGNANLGVFVRSAEQYPWLESFLSVDQLLAMMPDLAPHRIVRHVLPNLTAINFEIFGLLSDGVSSSLRPDPQAKGLSEYFRSIEVPIPAQFLMR